jgi:hypothetical protein
MADQTVDFFADRPTPELGVPGLSTAVADPSAAENDEGVPTFLDALGADATPEETDDQTEEVDETDWQARAAAAEGAIQQFAQVQQAQQQQAMYQQALQAFEEEARQHEAWAEENLGAQEAVQYLSQYRQGREHRMRTYFEQAMQTVINNVGSASYADHVIQHFGLDPEDKVLLGEDPQQMAARAEQLQMRDRRFQEKFGQTDRDIKNLKRGQQASRLVRSGATRSGGGGQRAPIANPSQLPPEQQLMGLLSGRIQDGY